MHCHCDDSAASGAQYLRTLTEAERRGQAGGYPPLDLARPILDLVGAGESLDEKPTSELARS